jgi:hypothetical protein
MPNTETQLYNVCCKFYDHLNAAHCESIPVYARSPQAACDFAVGQLKKYHWRGIRIDYVTA